MLVLLQNPVLQQAWISLLLVSVACAVIGPFVQVRKQSYFAGGVSHALLGGLGLGVFMGFAPFTSAMIGAITASLLIGYVSLHKKTSDDTIISILWSCGMALGILFLSFTANTSDVMSYLLGNILWVTRQTQELMLTLDLVLVAVMIWLYRPLVAESFDREFAQIRGLPVSFLYYGFLILVAVGLVIAIQAVGIVLVIALLSIPSAFARIFSRSVFQMMVLAFLYSLTFGTLALVQTSLISLPTSSMLILWMGAAYLITISLKSKPLQNN